MQNNSCFLIKINQTILFVDSQENNEHSYTIYVTADTSVGQLIDQIEPYVEILCKNSGRFVSGHRLEKNGTVLASKDSILNRSNPLSDFNIMPGFEISSIIELSPIQRAMQPQGIERLQLLINRGPQIAEDMIRAAEMGLIRSAIRVAFNVDSGIQHVESAAQSVQQTVANIQQTVMQAVQRLTGQNQPTNDRGCQ